MTTEELKAAMRQYADEHFPAGWEVASFQLCLGRPDRAERFIVLPDDPPAAPRPRQDAA